MHAHRNFKSTQSENELNKSNEGLDVGTDTETENRPGEIAADVPSCPCFTMQDLDDAMNDITGDGGFTFHEESSCTGETVTGIHYSYLENGEHPAAMGYGVGESSCQEGDAIHPDISLTEETACRVLIDTKCAENDIALNLDSYTPAFTCPCFDGDDLDRAFKNISKGDSEYVFYPDQSCTGGVNTGVQYSFMVNGEYPAAMGYGVSESTCQQADTLRWIELGEEIACRSLIQAKCSEHANVIS